MIYNDVKNQNKEIHKIINKRKIEKKGERWVNLIKGGKSIIINCDEGMRNVE